MEKELYAPLATVIAALLAALVGLVGIILSKEAKVSDFRQAWIDSLRIEVSELIANIMQSIKYLEMFEDQAWNKAEHQSAILRANTALYMIRLRLNPTENASKAMLDTLEQIEEFSIEPDFPAAKVHELERRLVAQSKVVLKQEWDRVQGGELTFRITKWSFVALVAGLALSGAILIFQISK